MSDFKNKFAQPDEDTPFGRHPKEVTRYLNIGIPSYTGTYNTTLPEEERWMIQVQVPGRTFSPTTKPIEFSFDAPTWSLGRAWQPTLPWDTLEKSTTRILRTLSNRYVGAEMSNGR